MEKLSRKIGRNEAEDRISTLPDELIHQILSFVDSDLAAQTCVLSKRWVNLWRTLPFLDFKPDHFDSNGVYYRKFVTGLLLNRNHESDTCSIQIDFRGFENHVVRAIVDYAISHHVEKFHISFGAKLEWVLNFPVLKHLSLTYCKVAIMNWNLHSLTTLYLESVTICGDKLNFQGFKNLKELTLRDCSEFYKDKDVFMICSSSVTSLTILDEFRSRALGKYVIWAPNLSIFQFSGWYVPVLSAVDGFPGLTEVKFNIDIGKYEWKEYSSEEKKQVLHKLINMLREFRETKFLSLSLNTVQVLSRVPDFSEYQPSPFGNLKSLIVTGFISQRYEKPANASIYVVNYLLSGSPGANIFKKDLFGKVKKCSREEDMFLRAGHDNLYELKSKIIASNKQATNNVQVNNVVAAWEGHRVLPQYVPLLTQIKQKRPETFEQFAPRTEIIYTAGLNMLCSSIGAFFTVSRAGFTSSTITHFRDLFADLEKWGFNTVWLVNLLNNADVDQTK